MTLETGKSLGLAEYRLYPDSETMADKKSAKPGGIDFAVIVTPNAQHYAAAKAFLLRGRDSFYPHAQAYSRIPSGHPEGYFEAFANIYKTYISALGKKQSGLALGEGDLDFPQAEARISGVKFIGKCVESSRKGALWVDF
jgi:hypothetical protein